MLKKFHEVVNEDYQASIATGTVNVNDPTTVVNINSLLLGALKQEFITPYIALEKVRKVLAMFAIHIEGTSDIFNAEEGDKTFAVMQFGKIVDMTPNAQAVEPPDAFIYFAWELNDNGAYDIWCQLVDSEELDELLSDEDLDDEEIEADEVGADSIESD